MTPCGHRFCTQCIMQWLEHHPTCPTCRARATADDLIEDRDYDAIVGKYTAIHIHRYTSI